MKKNFKIAVAALVLAVSASSSFAQNVDLASLVDTSDGGLVGTKAFVDAEFTLATGVSTYTENVALISQSGDLGNIAYIDQSGGAGNFAVIIQEDGTGTTPASAGNVAAIVQKGSYNRAVISQR